MVAFVSARPRFLAIPIEDIEFVRGPNPSPYYPHRRIARQANGIDFSSHCLIYCIMHNDI